MKNKLLLGLAILGMTGLRCEEIINDKTPAQSSHKDVAADGLWTNFDGVDGKISTDLSANAVVKDMAVDTNGDIYVCGSLGATAVMMVARYKKNNNGRWALDTGWDSGGSGYVTPGSSVFDSSTASVANAMALDGEYIYLTGQGDISTVSKVVAKINKSDGMLVTDFNTDGFFLSGLGTDAVGHGIAVDGTHVYAVGTDGTYFSVTKLNKSTGVADAAFDGGSGTGGMDGELTVDLTGNGDTAYDVAIDGNDLYVVGDAYSTFGVAKMDKVTGKLHTAANGFAAFSTDGLIAAGVGVAKAITHDDDNIYVVGHNGTPDEARVKKYKKTDGSLNSDFGTSGALGIGDIYSFEDVKILNGQLYAVGLDAGKGAVARMNTTGTSPLDTSFNTLGYNIADADNMTAGAVAVDFLPVANSPIVFAGYDASSGDYIELAAHKNNANPFPQSGQPAYPAAFAWIFRIFADLGD